MQFLYQTKRLMLKILGQDSASSVLAFYEENKDIFECWEPVHDPNFYTLNYQTCNLAAEMKLFLQQKLFRYYLFAREQPKCILGTVSFSHLINSPEYSCRLGYRLSKAAQGQGYATEALSFLIPALIKDRNILRIEANIMPDNTSSLHLIEGLGFEYEGIARKSFEINGKREDHLRYALVVS